MKKVTQAQVYKQVFSSETRNGSAEIHNAAIAVREYFTAPSGATPSVNWKEGDKKAFCREVVRVINSGVNTDF